MDANQALASAAANEKASSAARSREGGGAAASAPPLAKKPALPAKPSVILRAKGLKPVKIPTIDSGNKIKGDEEPVSLQKGQAMSGYVYL